MPTSNLTRKPQTAAATPIVRERDVKKYMHLVHQTVATFLRRLPPNVLRDDLVAAGTYGLIDSLRKNGEKQDPAFEYYIRIRIRGAILDELRAQDWLPRRTRWAASGKGTDVKTSGAAIPTAVIGFDDLPACERALSMPDALAPSPADAVEMALRHKALTDAVKLLPDRERTIVTLHYFRGVKFKDIGCKLGVSEPRISQLHARAMNRLRTMLHQGQAAA